MPSKLRDFRATALIATVAAGVCASAGTAFSPAASDPAGTIATASQPVRELNPPSAFGRLTSRRWAHGQPYLRENLTPVPNPHPAAEPQPDRDHPYDAAVSTDGRKVYVGLLGSEIRPGSEVAVYDVGQDRIVRRIRLVPEGEEGPPGSGPFRLALHPEGRYLLVTCRFSSFISVIDTRTDRVVSEIPLDFYAQDIAFQPDGRTAYVANRYLDQVFVVDIDTSQGRFDAKMRVLGGLDERSFTAGGAASPHAVLLRSCGTAGCHDQARGGFLSVPDARATFVSLLDHVRPGNARGSRLLRAVKRTRDGGYADFVPSYRGHAGGTVAFPEPASDPGYRTLERWIDSAADGPGIPVGNRHSKPKICQLTTDGRYLLVGNTGTQDISIVDTRGLVEVGGIHVQNVVNDLKIFRSPVTGSDLVVATLLGVGFGVGRERDPYGAESWDRENAAAHFSVRRDLETGRTLPAGEQRVLGPLDAVDGTAAIKFRDVQNDILVFDLGALALPPAPPAAGLEYLLLANRYEAHPEWVRYTSDTAESTYGDIKGDIPPELMRVVGAFPERMALAGDRLFVTMQGSSQVQELRIDPGAADPADRLVPVRTFEVGLQPTGIAAGRPGTVSEGLLFVTDFLGGTLSVIDTASGRARQAVVDPSVVTRPFPATGAERGELFVHTSLFSSDGDTSCFHCHYFDMGDGRPWGVSQVVGQQYVHGKDREGDLVIGGTMMVPQMRNLFRIQPFFLEGVISAYEPRSMIMEHNPADDYTAPTPQGDFTGIQASYVLSGIADVQSSMSSAANRLATLEERRDEMFRALSMRYLGRASPLRDFQRFVGDWQIAEPRLLPNPFDRRSASVERGRELFESAQVGCVSCHPPPDFTRKDLDVNAQQALPPLVTFTSRDGAFTLIGMNRLDLLNGIQRDLEPWDRGRAEERQGGITTLQLRGLFDRPPVFLHNGVARSLREVLCPPGHPALGEFRYEPLLGGEPERPGRREVGCNTTLIFAEPSSRVDSHLEAGARIGVDTHGGTSHLSSLEVDDLVHFMEAIE